MWMYVYPTLISSLGREVYERNEDERENLSGLEADSREVDKEEGADGRNGNSNMPTQSQD
jgi:hypothetical protein